MNPQTKPSSQPNNLQTYQVVLYDRALHPELFSLRQRRVVTHGAYELETWLIPGGHILRFEHGGKCLSELVTDQTGSLPQSGIVTAFLCAGERDFDKLFERERINYMTTVQTEQLSENLYLATLDEMRDYADEVEALRHEWADEAGPNLSMLDVQRFSREIHIQSYHLLASGGVVLRTQTIFEQHG